MAKFKFQCRCGKIIEDKTENILGASINNTDVICPECKTEYNVFIQITKIKVR